MNRGRWISILSIPCLVIFLSSCNGGESIATASFEETCWSFQDTISASIEIEDANEPIGLDVAVTFNNDYPHYNIFLWMETISPQGEISAETLEFILMNSGGTWFQDKSKEPSINLGLRPVNLMPEKGKYKIRLVQFMQEDELCGIKSLEVRKIF